MGLNLQNNAYFGVYAKRDKCQKSLDTSDKFQVKSATSPNSDRKYEHKDFHTKVSSTTKNKHMSWKIENKFDKTSKNLT